MNTAQLKTYAPAARRDFIKAVSAQAARLGITDKGAAPAELQGDVLLVAGQAFPRTIAAAREKLVRRVEDHGYEATMDAIAYTWFNRFVAIRYMELHGYLDHGYRVLSHPEGRPRPEILDHSADVDLAGLNRALAIELKLDGTKDEELYRLIFKAQCNALHQAMPFLFERIGDETELLLPANLLNTDSLIRQLVEDIEENAWEQIEVIGWLYQFYISERKDQVIGKVVKSEDIPAATQLFTPNWIVKYMVQNSLGAQWMATYPDSPLKKQMAYYVEPGEQVDKAKTQLTAVIPKKLNPEEMTLFDPACGSGHILVEAYDLLKVIYLERGYRQRDVAKLILEKNLFGLDIDARAAQMTGFALMMKGLHDDRQLFTRSVKIQIMAIADSTNFDATLLMSGINLADYGLQSSDLVEMKSLFEQGTTFGSLICIGERFKAKLPAFGKLAETRTSDLFVTDALAQLKPLIRQAEMLAAQYATVVANPPFLSTKNMTAEFKKFLKSNLPEGQKDTFAAFMLRALDWAAPGASSIGLVTPYAWMYLSTHESFRRHILLHATIRTLVELETNAFEPAMVTVCSFVFSPHCIADYKGSYIRLSSFKGSENQAPRTLEAIRNRNCGWLFESSQADFYKIPGAPVAYWASEAVRQAFHKCQSLSELAQPLKGMFTGGNEGFVRYFWEVKSIRFGCTSHEESADADERWYPFLKGGDFRKWYGNNFFVVNFYRDGQELRAGGKYGERNPDHYFKECLTWSDITSVDTFAVRYCEPGFLASSVGCGIYSDALDLNYLSGLLCAKPTDIWLMIINPTLHANPGDLGVVPLCMKTSVSMRATVAANAKRCIEIATDDWNDYEWSWGFQSLPVLAKPPQHSSTLECAFAEWISSNDETIAEMRRLEEENNRLFIEAYGLADELTPDVPIEQITLTVNAAYRYPGTRKRILTEMERSQRFRADTMTELISYAIGCMMGRFSLDEPGFVYAHTGHTGFDMGRYHSFPADDDGVVPLTDTDWFDDDAANRLVEFVSVAWDTAHLDANLKFLADTLSPNKNESSRDTIRRYLCDSFFKDHLQTYKKRPIYWLFSSGKQKGFQCLVYVHRYNEGTLARMRSEYVIPLLGKMAARLEKLQGDIQVATSTAHQRSLEKERVKLDKQHVEVLAFDEKLRHYADRRIKLDLDDGVRVNYGKFGDLLAGVKDVQGKEDEAE